jgi:hypothetical protein
MLMGDIVALSGCDKVFGLDEIVGTDGNTADAATRDAATRDAAARDGSSPMDSVSTACSALASYGNVTIGTQFAKDVPMDSQTGDHVELYLGQLDGDPDPDLLDVELYAGFGDFFGSDIHTGTYALTDFDASYTTCTVCVVIWTNTTMQGSFGTSVTVTDYYMANGGTLTLTSVANTLQGSISNATFTHVFKAPMVGGPSDVPVGDCDSSITSASFNTTLTPG